MPYWHAVRSVDAANVVNPMTATLVTYCNIIGKCTVYSVQCCTVYTVQQYTWLAVVFAYLQGVSSEYREYCKCIPGTMTNDTNDNDMATVHMVESASAYFVLCSNLNLV